ncbi:glutathione synthase [Candidatus Palibaumannia cicadellinicola]|uniref:Glutathione synthetase n=1 Tax=Baumannia cicadellinicola subsp. Homalodisca coagulata TaxID=374463 RepID=Q1LSZ5_BAUCH|nr:glutathione synthase [Candidatus Baumannia cicadellinicola]ABF14244.1 glutathione synthetase [Baumannia cicadellinicola str. Hc (Homalodisca coagulata)]MBS0032764.1 glutathione synthase [Candidatus Baumannia cicadellinicola]MCJ7462043.1 glutathione synthase [Candidatus Baumannia cicadellinicola]MCJ7463070.1 glutathione synthase [Candidatus Baumannia cicadellinicola]
MIKLGIVMDSIASINIKKDTSFALLLEAQKRGYKIFYMEINSLYLRGGEARASSCLLEVTNHDDDWYNFYNYQDIAISSLDVVLMRKNPPIDTEYIYSTYILERAEKQGTLVINKPQSLRDCNEKIFASDCKKYTPDTLVSQQYNHIRQFLRQHKDIILKPLNGMGGQSIFRLQEQDPNLSVIIETLTSYGKNFCMAQTYLPSIKEGDKRVFIIDGQPVPYCLARIPQNSEIRGNLAAGGYGEARSLSSTDWSIAYDLGLILRKRGLMFVGLDIIGDKLTEINITSPTCICEIEAAFPISITGMLMDAIEKNLQTIK